MNMSAEPQLSARVIRAADSTPEISSRLFQLFSCHYQNVDRAAFDRDQQEKDWLLLLSSNDGEIRGFTTAMLWEATVDGRRVRAMFSGNTIIQAEYRGDQQLVKSFGRLMAEVKFAEPDSPLYWFLICSGYRTYMYLPLFHRKFYPNHKAPAPAFEAALIDQLGKQKFPEEYRGGVVYVPQPRENLPPQQAVPPPHKLANPHVAFFIAQNPGYLRGDELVCVAEYSIENLRGAAQRVAAEVAGKTQ